MAVVEGLARGGRPAEDWQQVRPCIIKLAL
jgi:hypothetical protein